MITGTVIIQPAISIAVLTLWAMQIAFVNATTWYVHVRRKKIFRPPQHQLVMSKVILSPATTPTLAGKMRMQTLYGPWVVVSLKLARVRAKMHSISTVTSMRAKVIKLPIQTKNPLNLSPLEWASTAKKVAVVLTVARARCGSIRLKIVSVLVISLLLRVNIIPAMIVLIIPIALVSDTHWLAHAMLSHWIRRVSGLAPITPHQLRYGPRMKMAPLVWNASTIGEKELVKKIGLSVLLQDFRRMWSAPHVINAPILNLSMMPYMVRINPSKDVENLFKVLEGGGRVQMSLTVLSVNVRVVDYARDTVVLL